MLNGRTGPEVAFTMTTEDGEKAAALLTEQKIVFGAVVNQPVPEGHIRLIVSADDAGTVEGLIADADLTAEGRALG
jgi:hypothetical protein